MIKIQTLPIPLHNLLVFLLASAFYLPWTESFTTLWPCIGRPNQGRSSQLYSGYGIADSYTWKEEAFEIDVTVKVPAGTKAKDIVFEATSRSIDLKLSNGTVLLDKERQLRGRVNLDGTYWVISDPDSWNDNEEAYREVTVTIEKLIKTPADDFEVVDYDWKGVYHNDTEVSERQYDEPEPLDVRKYAASLGVDIDNINMSQVDKTMFSSNLNMTKNTLDELNKAGYLDKQEVTRQADGTEYVTDEDGDPIPYSGLMGMPETRPKIPFIDDDIEEADEKDGESLGEASSANQTIYQQTRNFTRAAFAQDSSKPNPNNPFKSNSGDPIDDLTVKRLKEILKSQGLKVSGNKKELQDRLRAQVNSLLQGSQD